MAGLLKSSGVGGRDITKNDIPWIKRVHYVSGVKFFEHVKVEDIVIENEAVRGVKTDQGEIQCQYFVNCAGQVSLTPFAN